MARQLVVNADDLGLTVGVNDGIFDAHDHGILTSASLIAAAPAAADAISRLIARPSMGIGVHLTLVDGSPVLPASRIPTLVEANGRFRQSWRSFVVACLRGRVSLVEAERELGAQIERMLAAGISPTHLDSHQHVHAYPPLFAIVARLAIRHAIPVVRVPYERGSWLPHERSQAVFRQTWQNAAMWPWASRNYRLAASVGLRTPALIGRVHTGALSWAGLRTLIRGTQPGVTELMVHPGYLDAELRAANTRLLESRRQELDLLRQPHTRALLRSERIDLVRHDLVNSSERSFRYVS